MEDQDMNKTPGEEQETDETSGTEEEETKKLFVGKEKQTIAIFLVLLLLLTVKSVFLDEVKNLNPEEAQFKAFVEYSLEENYGGLLTALKLMSYRVYHIDLEDPEAQGVLRYEDPDTGKIIEVVQEGRYSGKVRGYLFSILPIRHFSVTSQTAD